VVEFKLEEIISFLITLYAIVPSIIITVMYSFLSEIEEDLAEVWENITMEIENREDFLARAQQVNKFLIISAKIFHVSMAYYLIQLGAALISKCFPIEGRINLLIIPLIASLSFFLYFILYWCKDAHDSLRLAFGKNKERNYVYFLVWSLYGAIPIILIVVFIFFTNYDEIRWHLWWITITILHLLSWWLIIPFKYRPLTHLSFIRRGIKKDKIRANSLAIDASILKK